MTQKKNGEKEKREVEKSGIRNKIKNAGAVFAAIMTIVSATACGLPFQDDLSSAENAQTPERADTGFVLTGPDSFDSADTAILTGRDEKENTLTFLNLDLGRRYTLSVNGTTRLYDKYGNGLSMEQFRIGDIVDVTFLKSQKHLTTMQLSASAWSYTDVSRYELNVARSQVTIGENIYELTENTQYLSGDKAIEIMDLNPSDVLSFQGIDTDVLTVRVDKGHGYLRLVNDENFVGGWIEIGQTQIQKITEDMLLTVPEGSYEVNISNKGGGGVKTVVINRNEETCLDIGDLEIPEPQYGMVLFSLNPSDTKLYIDGEPADTSEPVSLEYGLHQLIAKADGYHSITQYIRVGQASAGIDIVLDALEEGETESTSFSETTSTQTATGYYKIYVDAPENVEIYLDGNYIGISPCSFKKTAGSHTITLRKTGYVTRSYTVQIDEEEKDLTLSFADMVPTEGTVVNTTSANTSSANTSSANTSSSNTSSQE